MVRKSVLSKSVLLMMLVTSVVLAQEALSREFLDYLAEFATEEGEWIDPMELEMMANLDDSEAQRDSSQEAAMEDDHE